MQLRTPTERGVASRRRWTHLASYGYRVITWFAFWTAVLLLGAHLVVLPAMLLGIVDGTVLLGLAVVHAAVLALGHEHEPSG